MTRRQIKARMDDHTIKRLQALAPVVGTLSQAIRAAIAIGLEELERRQGVQPADRQ